MPAGSATQARELPFATTTYEADQDEVLRAVLPSRCVYATGEQTCDIFVDHYRERKTGPCFPIAVVGCRTHPHRRYTLYPPGHYPYGGAPVAPCSVTGGLLLDAATGQPKWETTVLAAAADAEQGKLWPAEVWYFEHDAAPCEAATTPCEAATKGERPLLRRNSASSPSRGGDAPTGSPPSAAAGRRRTQGRQLRMAGRLTGVHPQLEQRQRERIASRLAVPTLTLIAGARRWGRSLQTRGAAVIAVLKALAIDASLLDRLLAAGAVSGLWNAAQPRSAPRRWDAALASWVIAPAADAAESTCAGSQPVEQRAAGDARQRAPPLTTVLHPNAERRSTVGA